MPQTKRYLKNWCFKHLRNAQASNAQQQPWEMEPHRSSPCTPVKLIENSPVLSSEFPNLCKSHKYLMVLNVVLLWIKRKWDSVLPSFLLSFPLGVNFGVKHINLLQRALIWQAYNNWEIHPYLKRWTKAFEASCEGKIVIIKSSILYTR